MDSRLERREIETAETEKRVLLGVALTVVALLLLPWPRGEDVPAFRVVLVDPPPLEELPLPDPPPPPPEVVEPKIPKPPIVVPGPRDVEVPPEEHVEPEVERFDATPRAPRSDRRWPPRPPAGRSEPVREGLAGLEKPRLIEAPTPRYPAACRVTQRGGEVIVEALIGRDGSVLSARLLKRASCEPLNQAALEAVLARRYVPGRLEGREVEVFAIVKVDFQLR